MPYGVTAAGFVKKTMDIIWAELVAAARAAFGADVDVSEYSPLGQLLQMMADQLREVWDGLEDDYYSNYIDSAEGTTLEYVAALGGISRRPATRAVVDLLFTGVEATIIPVGFEAQTPQGVKFLTIESGAIAGTGFILLEATAVETGPQGNVAENTITEINTPISGLNYVVNSQVALGGAYAETDAELRTRYKLRGVAGGSTAVAIQAAIQNLDSVVTAVCYENNTDGSVDGMTPHSIELVVEGGTDQSILDAFLLYKPAGIETIGNEEGVVVDSAGVSRTLRFSRPTTTDVYVAVTITPDAEWEAGFEEAVKQKVVELVGGTFEGVAYPGMGIGVDIHAWRIIANLRDLVGIENVRVYVGETENPSGAVVDIARAARATTDDSLITISVV